MGTDKISGRELKKKIFHLLQAEDFRRALDDIRRFPSRRAVNPLFSFLCRLEPLIRWHAITAMGKVVADLAETDPESARVIMRRLIWQLNDESGGIGWGCPEAMGAILAESPLLAKEYSRLFLSYLRPGGTYLEHEGLQRGLLWGVGYLAHARPELAGGAAAELLAFLQSTDPALRGLALWALAPLANREIAPYLEALAHDEGNFELYHDGVITRCSIGQTAREILKRISNAW